MKTLSYIIPNISCNHCTHTIKLEIGEMAGVAAVEADVDTKQVVIQFEAPASEEKIVSLLTEIGFPPENSLG